MEIPAFFTTYDDDGMHVSNGHFTPTNLRADDRAKPFSEVVPEAINREIRQPVVVMDCNSFAQRGFSEKVMKHLRIPGADVWFMTCINTVDDVFDAFNRDATFVLAPYHMIYNDYELKDIIDVSDSVVPVIFVSKGKAVIRGRRRTDVTAVLDKLVDLGYYRNCVLDTDDSVDAYTWSIIASDYPSTIPFVDNPSRLEGHKHVITPYLL
jgi:hypothetical protein